MSTKYGTSAKSARRWMVAYDVSDNRRRTRLANLLEGVGQRIQNSVFNTECTQHEMVSILTRAEQIIDEGDRLMAYPVTGRSAISSRAKQRHSAEGLPAFWIA